MWYELTWYICAVCGCFFVPIHLYKSICDHTFGDLNDIYDILKVGGLFRLSLPDYRCDILKNRVFYRKDGNIHYDPGSGSTYENGIVSGGALWFPVYEKVKEMCRGKPHITYDDFYNFIDGLDDLSLNAKQILKQITPETYIGNAKIVD